jgi:hypothetical protein
MSKHTITLSFDEFTNLVTTPCTDWEAHYHPSNMKQQFIEDDYTYQHQVDDTQQESIEDGHNPEHFVDGQEPTQVDDSVLTIQEKAKYINTVLGFHPEITNMIKSCMTKNKCSVNDITLLIELDNETSHEISLKGLALLWASLAD